MKINKIILFFLCATVLPCKAGDNLMPHFSNKPVSLSEGPFSRSLKLNDNEKKKSKPWKELLQKELNKEVNFAGHYRVVLIKDGAFPEECGGYEWVCGWIIDKESGEIISELPRFNNNTKYYSTLENGTPVSDEFDIEFYANSSMMWISGMNKPVKGEWNETKCATIVYDFVGNKFSIIKKWRCEVDVGDDKNANPYLP